MPPTAAERGERAEAAAPLLRGLQRLTEAVSRGGGTAGVIGVAAASPLAFGRLPWVVAVVVVFLVGIAVELGPGLLLEALLSRRRQQEKVESKQQQEQEGESRAAASAALEAASAAGPRTATAPASPATSLRQRRARARPQSLEAEAEAEADSPTAAGGASSSGAGSQSGTPTAASVVSRRALAAAGVARREGSLREASVEVKEWRVVEGNFAAYKVLVVVGGGGGSKQGAVAAGSWTVWRRFSDFEALREALAAARSSGSSGSSSSNDSPQHHSNGGGSSSSSSSRSSGASSLPQLPAKTLFKNLSPRFLAKRAAALQAFLRALLDRPALCDDPSLRAFLDATPLVVTSSSSSGQQTAQPLPPLPHPSPARSEEGVIPEPVAAVAAAAEEEEEGDMEGRAAPAVETKEEGGRGQQQQQLLPPPQEQEQEQEQDQLHHASQPGAAQRCGGCPPPAGLGVDGDEDEEGEEGEEGEEEEGYERLRASSGSRRALSTASTDDGVEDEERAREAAASLMETMRELSARSPNDWPALGEEGGAERAERAAAAAAAAAVSAATTASLLPASCRGMSLAAYQALSLRLQHPTAYYDPGPSNAFHVRGRHYMVDGRKIPAGPAIGRLLLAMVFTVPPHYPGGREDHAASRGRVAERLAALRELDARGGRPPFCFVLNFQVPGDPPLSLVCVFALPQDRRPETDGTAFWPLFDRFVDFGPVHSSSSHAEGSPAASSPTGVFPLDDVRNRRFKLIPAIVDGPSMIKWAVGNKPTILGQKLTQRYFRGEDYVELDVDIASSAVASQIVSLCRGYARHLKVQMAIVLQGEGEAELPERLIGCIGIDHLDINHAADGPNVVEEGEGGGGSG